MTGFLQAFSQPFNVAKAGNTQNSGALYPRLSPTLEFGGL